MLTNVFETLSEPNQPSFGMRPRWISNFDIFRRFPDGRPVWMEGVEGLGEQRLFGAIQCNNWRETPDPTGAKAIVTMRNGFSKEVVSLVFSMLVWSITSHAQNQVPGSLGSASFVQDQSNSSIAPESQTQSQIVEQLLEMNSRRAQALLSYEGTRRYWLSYQGFWGTRRAEMVVRVRFRAPGPKEFTIVSQNGSKWMIDKIFKGLLQSEREGEIPDNASRLALDPANYEFTLVGQDSTPSGQVYVLSIKPRSNYRYLCRGQIWVDASDFAVVEIKGEPARNPSSWLRNTSMEVIYTKVGNFWLPSRNHSVSQVRLGGKADLTIEYSDYKIIETTLLAAQ